MACDEEYTNYNGYGTANRAFDAVPLPFVPFQCSVELYIRQEAGWSSMITFYQDDMGRGSGLASMGVHTAGAAGHPVCTNHTAPTNPPPMIGETSSPTTNPPPMIVETFSPTTDPTTVAPTEQGENSDASDSTEQGDGASQWVWVGLGWVLVALLAIGTGVLWRRRQNPQAATRTRANPAYTTTRALVVAPSSDWLSAAPESFGFGDMDESDDRCLAAGADYVVAHKAEQKAGADQMLYATTDDASSSVDAPRPEMIGDGVVESRVGMGSN